MSITISAPLGIYLAYPWLDREGKVHIAQSPVVAYEVTEENTVEPIGLAAACDENLVAYAIHGAVIMPDGRVFVGDSEMPDLGDYLRYCIRHIEGPKK